VAGRTDRFRLRGCHLFAAAARLELLDVVGASLVVGELLILLPFSKFAHAIYRTTALYVHALKPLSKVEPAGAGDQEEVHVGSYST